jgi:predicted Zn-ribbon and HTH transcriptional regulator
MLAREILARLVVHLFSSEEILVYERRRSGETLVPECRNCGTTLETVNTPCPACTSTEVAIHQF